jgi:hypothetical protein
LNRIEWSIDGWIQSFMPPSHQRESLSLCI